MTDVRREQLRSLFAQKIEDAQATFRKAVLQFLETHCNTYELSTDKSNHLNDVMCQRFEAAIQETRRLADRLKSKD